MSLLFKIVYAAHANGTHHKLALDALKHLTNPDAERWTRLFLKHSEVYLEGSKAPDDEFKDFKNHVLHVRDNYWGGAPEKALAWYTHLVEGLKASDFERSVYAAGVLSHYLSDPIHPFHTGQTAAENNVHRAVEWSINRSYNPLREQAEAAHADMVVGVPASPHWIKDLVCSGADFSNRYYEKLIAHYDIHRGVVDPPEGLDNVARADVAQLLMLAAKTIAFALDRAFEEAGTPAPDVNLTAQTLIATLKIPAKFVTKKITDAETRRQVEAMYDELKTTGQVEVNLPADDRAVRDLHAAEVAAPRAAAQQAERQARLPVSPPAHVSVLSTAPVRGRSAPPAAVAGARPAHPNRAAELKRPIQRSEPARVERPIAAAAPPPAPPPAPAPARAVQEAPIAPPQTVERTERPERAERTSEPTRIADAQPRTPRRVVKLTDPLEDAPSIGPKMAERFQALGVTTVGDFLAQDAETMAELMSDWQYSAATLRRWQQQAGLVTTIPGLNGTQAQLLTGAGLTTAAAIAAADPVDLSAKIMAFATTTEGKRILRDGSAPDLERIKAMVSLAADAAKAA